jgi:RHS repeat-associated protein
MKYKKRLKKKKTQDGEWGPLDSGKFGGALSIFAFQVEMDFDAWREDKGEHTGGIPQCMLRMSRIPQATKQGAKCARPLSREKTRRIVWNEDNKPVTITTSTGTVTFMYDGNGNRVKKTKGSNTTYYYGDAYEKRNTVGIIHLFANHQRLASIRTDGKNQYYHGNHLGSASVITDQNGNLKQKIEYFPFGTYRYGTSPDQQMGTYDYDTTFPNANYTFTDQEDDDETGLYNYKARLYDPQLGRFISADTIVPRPWDLQSFNRYSYCSNNPLVYTDPSGHEDGDGSGESGGSSWWGAAWDAICGFFSSLFGPSVKEGDGTGVIDFGMGNGVPENNKIDTTYQNRTNEERSGSLGSLLYDFLSGLLKGHENDGEDKGDEGRVMYAQNRGFSQSLRSAWDKAVDLGKSAYNWAGGIAKAIGIVDTGKTAIDSMNQMNERSNKYDNSIKGIGNDTSTQKQIEALDALRLNADKDVTGPPARVGEKGADLVY